MRIWLVNRPDTVIGAYWPIKGEFDPLPALHRWKETASCWTNPCAAASACRWSTSNTKRSPSAWYPGCPMEKTPTASPSQDTGDRAHAAVCALCGLRRWRLPAGLRRRLYDRTLARCPPNPSCRGAGFSNGYLDEFEARRFDLPLDAILNDNGVVWPV